MVSDELEALDLEVISDPGFDPDVLSGPMHHFVAANLELVKILRRDKASPQEPRTPPDKSTVPVNPKFSGESTDSTES